MNIIYLKSALEFERILEEQCKKAETLLSPKKYMVFLLHYRHGYSLKQIAELLGICEGNVSRRLKRMRNQLRHIDSRPVAGGLKKAPAQEL